MNKEFLLLVESDRCIVGNSQRIRNSGIDAFELWCWRRLLKVPWTAKRSNQSVLKGISLEYLLERLMLKFQYFDHLMRTADSLEKTLMPGKIEGRRWRGKQRMRWLAGITNSMSMNLGKHQDMLRDKEDLHAADHGIMQSEAGLGN